MSNGCPFHGEVWCTCRPPLALQKPSAVNLGAIRDLSAEAAELARLRAQRNDLLDRCEMREEQVTELRTTLAAADALAEAVRRRRANGNHGNCEPGDCEQCDALAAYDRARKGE